MHTFISKATHFIWILTPWTVTHVSCSRPAGEKRAGSCPRHAGRPPQRSAVSPSASGAAQNHCPTPAERCLSQLTTQMRHIQKNIHLNCLSLHYCVLEFSISWKNAKCMRLGRCGLCSLPLQKPPTTIKKQKHFSIANRIRMICLLLPYTVELTF